MHEILAVSFMLGMSGFPTYFVFLPAKFWKLQFVCAHVIPTWAGFKHIRLLIYICFCHLPCHIIIIFSCNVFLVFWLTHFGTFLFLTANVCKVARRMKKDNQFPAQVLQLAGHENVFSTFKLHKLVLD